MYKFMLSAVLLSIYSFSPFVSGTEVSYHPKQELLYEYQGIFYTKSALEESYHPQQELLYKYQGTFYTKSALQEKLFTLVGSIEEFLRVLTDYQLDPHYISKDGHNYLTKASDEKNWELVRYLANRGVNVKHESPEGTTPLRAAAFCGSEYAVQELLLAGAGEVRANKTIANTDVEEQIQLVVVDTEAIEAAMDEAKRGQKIESMNCDPIYQIYQRDYEKTHELLAHAYSGNPLIYKRYNFFIKAKETFDQNEELLSRTIFNLVKKRTP